MLKELDIAKCDGQGCGSIQIIQACATETFGKLELLIVFIRQPSQTNQFIESLAKIRVKRLRYASNYPGFFPRSYDRAALILALSKNSSIVELRTWLLDDATRRSVAPILHRNKLWVNITMYLLGETTADIMPSITPDAADDVAITITDVRGRWSRILGEIGQTTQVPLPCTRFYKRHLRHGWNSSRCVLFSGVKHAAAALLLITDDNNYSTGRGLSLKDGSKTRMWIVFVDDCVLAWCRVSFQVTR
jgi:hypothetical protein